jgi:hypothetical protein
MPVSKIGRNDPCPCGSGRKYKHCCLRRGVPQMVQRRNQMPLDDFDGLSPEQMSGLLHAPFDSPGLLEFAPVLAMEPETAITGLFGQLCEALDAGRLKATAKGNLPRAFCQQAYASLAHVSPFAVDALVRFHLPKHQP